MQLLNLFNQCAKLIDETNMKILICVSLITCFFMYSQFKDEINQLTSPHSCIRYEKKKSHQH